MTITKFTHEIKDEIIYICFPFSWEAVSLVKSTNIMSWDKNLKRWYCADNDVNRKTLNSKLGLALPIEEKEIKIELNPILLNHQKNDVITGIRQKRWLFQNDTGTGKTITALDIIKNLNVKTLIVCPISLIKNAWIEDINKFDYKFRPVNFWEMNRKWNNKEIENLLYSFHIGIINYELFRIFSKKYDMPSFGIDCLILDESGKVKNTKAQVTKDIIKLADTVNYIFSLSATPAPNSIMEYFSQVRMINPSLWGKSFYKWKLDNFNPQGYGGFKWVIKNEKTENKLLKDIASVSSCIKKEDVLDLPERTFNTRSVELSSEERAAYKAMANDLFLELSEDTGISAANAAVKISKLRQITSGFIINSDSQEIVEIGKTKLNELVDLLEEIGNKQVIIWTNYQYEAVMISKMFDDINKTYGICNGTKTQKQQDDAISAFKKNRIQYLIAHPASIGHGVTLVNCSYAIYFSRSYSYAEQYQSQDRIYRFGQKNQCTYFFIDAEYSIDIIIKEAVYKKQQLNEVFIDYMKGGKGNG